MRVFSFLMLLIVAAILLTSNLVSATEDKDLYGVLEINKDATEAEIKKAFRKLSLKYHPDKNPGDEAAALKYSEITNAYEILSDVEKRSVYDLDGMKGLKEREQGGGRGMNPFDMFFGGGGRQQNKAPSSRFNVGVTLQDLYNGARRDATIQRNVICPKCKGSGAKDGVTEKCPKCQGQGVILVTQRMGPGFNVQMQQQCDKCGGRGVTFKTRCPHCKGEKLIRESKTLVIEIEKGMPSNHELLYEKEGEQQPGMAPGDIIFALQQNPHHLYRREGNDLHHDMTISLREALLGVDRRLVHMDDHEVVVRKTGITIPGEVLRIEEEGMPHHNFPSDFGSLFIKFTVAFPPSLSDQQKSLVRQMLPA